MSNIYITISSVHALLHKYVRLFCAGTITTKARIDYESIKQIYVNAYVTDTGIPQMTSTAEIIVEIVNMNDNEPVFSLHEYRFTVAENSPKGNFIGKINAKDDDDGELFVHTTLEQKSILDYPLSVALLLLSTPIDPHQPFHTTRHNSAI